MVTTDTENQETKVNLDQTADERAEAKRYARVGLWCELLDRVVDVAFLAVMAFVVGPPIADALSRVEWLATDTLRLIVLHLAMFALHVAVSFPLSYYSGYVVERRFGLSRLSLGGWFARYLKRMGLALAFNTILFVGLFWVIWLTGPLWWIFAALAALVVTVVVGQLLPVLILPLFYKIERLTDAELEQRMARLADGTGLTIEGVYRMGLSAETSKANAMLAGLGRTRRVLMGDTLLSEFTPEEIEVVFAHEIGHHVFGHLQKMIAASVVYTMAGFWICDRLMAAWLGASYDPHRLPIVALPFLMLALVLFQYVLEPLQNAIMRRFERQCDRYALQRTNDSAAFTSAFQKLARQNKADVDPHPLEVFWLHDHPAIGERLAMAQAYQLEATTLRR
jgi:STE24 endopeptidase